MSTTDIIQTFGIFVAIGIATWQAWAYRKQLQFSTNALLANQLTEINRLLFEHPEVFVELEQPYPIDGFHQGGDRRHHLMHLILNTFEQVFMHHRHDNLIDGESWKSWTRTFKYALQKPYARGHWEAQKGQYTTAFCRFIDTLLQQLDATNSSKGTAPSVFSPKPVKETSSTPSSGQMRS